MINIEGTTLQKVNVIIEAQTSDYKKAIAEVKSQTDKVTNAISEKTDVIKSSFEKISNITQIKLPEQLEGLIDAINPCFEWVSDKILAPIESWVGFLEQAGEVTEVLGQMGEAFKNLTIEKIADKLETIQLTLMYAQDFIISLAKGTVELAKQAIQFGINTAAKIADAIAQTAMNVATAAWNTICTIATAVTTAFGAAVAFLTSPIGLVILAIAALIAVIVLIVKNFDTIKTVAGNVWNAIKEFFGNIGIWFKEKFDAAVTALKNAFAGIGNFFSSIWDGIKSAFSNVTDWFKNIFSNAWDAVKNVFSTGGKVFSGIKDGIASVFKTVVNTIIRGINTVVAVPFNAINGVLDKLRSLSIAGIKPFTWLPALSVPQIPELADGGMLNAGQMFIAREAGPELIGNFGNKTAVMNNNQIVESVSRGVYDAVSAAMNNSGNNNHSPILEFTLMAGTETLYKIVRKGQESMDQRYNIVSTI